MMSDSVRIVLELEPQADPISGRLYSDGSPPRRFDGYVQLIGLIQSFEQTRAPQREPSDQPPKADP
jgi:hypothetical protein